MNILSTNNISFTYHGGAAALSGVTLDIPEGSFVTVCGESGCGKSTLLRLMKPALTPRGELSGELFYCGELISSLSEKRAASEIGFVMQDPESQIVTDKVWHELAFALESTGVPVGDMRRRVAEMSCYFGIEELFERDTASLSGGQKQLLNLASAAALHPKLLILDEPTSQLDPIAAQGFITAVSRLNRDFGVTVVIAEHRLEELLHVSDRLVVMEKGRVIADCEPRGICGALAADHPMMAAMPVSVRLYSLGGGREAAPLTVREGRSDPVCSAAAATLPDPYPESRAGGELLLSARELWVSYGRNQPDVLKSASIDVKRGRVYAVLGGNGSGKTTLLKTLCGMIKPLGGRVKRAKSCACAYLPQDPCELFAEDTVKEELSSVCAEWQPTAERFGLCGLLGSHPYDLSGGERQRLALAKLMLKQPDVLLLDEPTKGMDAAAKAQLCQTLRSISDDGADGAVGAAVVLVTHDTELAAACADICGLLFGGEMVCEAPPSEFFPDSYFYTTPLCRMRR
ncbi:MAG: ATP-binding cassette domain-containing protein [Oscillospiraceae bacterium]|nr:ATP-binding cassette domain-containing protein [Oscillospiraceae bacterium]